MSDQANKKRSKNNNNGTPNNNNNNSPSTSSGNNLSNSSTSQQQYPSSSLSSTIDNKSSHNPSVPLQSSSTTTTTTTTASTLLLTARLLPSATSSSGSSSSTHVHPHQKNINPSLSIDQIRSAAQKATNETPPHVHLSLRDSAPQLKIEDGPSSRRLVLRGGMRGYRMSRASHGVSEGNWFYEVLVLKPPSAKDVTELLNKKNVKFGAELERQLEEELLLREKEKRQSVLESAATDERGKKKQRKVEGTHNNKQDPNLIAGGHLRMGFAMRTGDLQAPVGYDRWSYAIRDIMGSRIHNSRREDHWGGMPFGPGDVIGFAITLTPPIDSNNVNTPHNDPKNNHQSNTKRKIRNLSTPSTSQTNQIRFFKNGEAMGQFVISRNIRTGGDAFDNITGGTYYPAISAYMGGTARVNFGPHFIYNIHASQLPSGMKLRPFAERCPAPLKPDVAVTLAMKEKTFPKKTDEGVLKAFKMAVLTEARIRLEAYEDHLRRHVEEVREERLKRKLSTNDLPPPPPVVVEMMDGEKMEDADEMQNDADAVVDVTVAAESTCDGGKGVKQHDADDGDMTQIIDRKDGSNDENGCKEIEI